MLIFHREWRRSVKAMLVWAAILSALIVLMLSMFPQFAENQQALNDMLEAYPESLRKAFGMNELNFGTMIGFYGIEAYLLVTLIGSVYAALSASGILVKEEDDKTIEFLLAKPVTRAEIVAGKLGTVVCNLLAFNAILTLAALIGFQFGDDPVPVRPFVWLAVGAFLLHLTFAAAAFLMSALLRRSRNIISISLALVFLSYALDIAAGISDRLSGLKHLSFFHYVDAAELIRHGAMDLTYAAIMGILIVLCAAAAFICYQRKDITT
jgi:ABC-2 type transport system permease protein